MSGGLCYWVEWLVLQVEFGGAEGIGMGQKERLLNMHFTMPPMIRTVEMMTGDCGARVYGVCISLP